MPNVERKAIVLAGRHEPTDERYQPIVKILKDKGYDAEFYIPDYEQTTIKALVGDFLKFNDNKPVSLLLGFSLGGMIALIASTVMDMDNLILCSPSGFFKEYKKDLSISDYQFAKKHLKDFTNFSAKLIAENSKTKHGAIICGQLELDDWPEFKIWMHDLTTWTNWPLGAVPDVKHKIEAPEYRDEIIKVINSI